MTQWYQRNRELFCKERNALVSTCPLMRMVIAPLGFRINRVSSLKHESAIAHGTYLLRIPDSNKQIEYGIVLVFPNNYPKEAPLMFCNDPKLPIGDIDRHIMNDGMACLGVHAEIYMRWQPSPNFVNFLEQLVAPFLAWQAYYDVYQKPPSWGERSHYGNGIIQFYAELLGRKPDPSVANFIQLLAKKDHPKGHTLCPCNSGVKLRNCHKELVDEMRKRIPWQEVEKDLSALLLSNHRFEERN